MLGEIRAMQSQNVTFLCREYERIDETLKTLKRYIASFLVPESQFRVISLSLS